MLPESIESALAAVARRLRNAGIEYCLGGSAMLDLAGFEVPVGDIDLVVAAESRAVVEEIFEATARRTAVEPWQSDWFLRTEWSQGDAKVGIDVIGGLVMTLDGRRAVFPLASEQQAGVGDMVVPLVPLRHWYHLYRAHAPDKAQLIAGSLTDDEIIEGAHELGIGDVFSPTLIVRIGNESHTNTIEEDMSTDQQSSIIEVASPTDVSFDAPGTSAIDPDLLNETLEYIRPALQADGGDLILLGTQGGKVTLQMVGACGGCPLSTMTLTAGIERILQDRVPGVTEVVSV